MAAILHQQGHVPGRKPVRRHHRNNTLELGLLLGGEFIRWSQPSDRFDGRKYPQCLLCILRNVWHVPTTHPAPPKSDLWLMLCRLCLNCEVAQSGPPAVRCPRQLARDPPPCDQSSSSANLGGCPVPNIIAEQTWM